MVKKVAMIVAHPDDETLWAGGMIITNQDWDWNIYCLTRESDRTRSARFKKVLTFYKAEGAMADLDDSSMLKPVPLELIKETILELLGGKTEWDILITHGPRGEYTRHVRHEETFRGVADLWAGGLVEAKELWLFAYEDGGGEYLPKADENADDHFFLPTETWAMKKNLIREIYGFDSESWEARTTPKTESFWKFSDLNEFNDWRKRRGEK